MLKNSNYFVLFNCGSSRYWRNFPHNDNKNNINFLSILCNCHESACNKYIMLQVTATHQPDKRGNQTNP